MSPTYSAGPVTPSSALTANVAPVTFAKYFTSSAAAVCSPGVAAAASNTTGRAAWPSRASVTSAPTGSTNPAMSRIAISRVVMVYLLCWMVRVALEGPAEASAPSPALSVACR